MLLRKCDIRVQDSGLENELIIMLTVKGQSPVLNDQVIYLWRADTTVVVVASCFKTTSPDLVQHILHPDPLIKTQTGPVAVQQSINVTCVLSVRYTHLADAQTPINLYASAERGCTVLSHLVSRESFVFRTARPFTVRRKQTGRTLTRRGQRTALLYGLQREQEEEGAALIKVG